MLIEQMCLNFVGISVVEKKILDGSEVIAVNKNCTKRQSVVLAYQYPKEITSKGKYVLGN